MQHSLLTDIAISLLLVAFIALFAIAFVDFSVKPQEDAAILMRYAENFARGHGIVWNVGDKPVEGGTDFLFLIAVGLLFKAGLSLEFATRSIGFASHVLTVLIVYWTVRRRFQAGLFPALSSSLYLATGPGLYYVAAYFGTPFFALFACVTWCLAVTLIEECESHRRSLLFAVSALVTGLIRPEGIILSGLILLAVIYLKGPRNSRHTILDFLGVFMIIGGAYFAWRWHYFGYPFPNPFYKKGAGDIYLGSFKVSLENVLILCWPFLTGFVLGLSWPKTFRKTIAFSIPILGFASAFILLSSEMNFAARFQYAVVPIVLMSWWPLLAGIRDDLRFLKWREFTLRRRATLVLAATVGLIAYQGLVIHRDIVGRETFGRDGRYDVGLILKDYHDRDFTVATTEAGLLPLYSGWRTIDAWGLNDQWIAHHGAITAEYLDRFKPEVIMFHEFSLPLVPVTGAGEWFEMVRVMKAYAEVNTYTLAAAFWVSPHHTHYYYVRADFPEGAEIISRIRAVDYWCLGQKAIDYASLAPAQY